jgi:heat shock protein HslJ
MLRSRQRIAMLIVLALTVALAACGGPSETAEPTKVEAKRTGTPSVLDGTEWVLTSLNGSSLIEGTNITLNFADGILGGFAGCNAYGGGRDSGKYVATDEGTLTIPQMAVTLQLCQTPEGVMEQEAAYIEALQIAVAYRVMGDRLEIKDAEGRTTLVFTRKEEALMEPSDLVGTEWQLVSWNGDSPIEGSTITLAFHNEYQVSGRAGCRGYVATYEASGDDIKFLWVAMMGMACLEQDTLMEQEGQYTTILGWATDYWLGEGKLEILTARGEVLVFEPLSEDATASMEETTWGLMAFIEKKPVEGMPAPLLMPTDLLAETEITATFGDGTVRGSAGCNTYSAAYDRDGSSLHFEPPEATEMACGGPAGITEQEQRYLGFLKDVTAYRIHGNQLWLETDDGRALVFVVADNSRNMVGT